MKTPLLITVLRRGFLLPVLAGLLCGLAARAQTPQFMTYQGYLTDQNGSPLGTNGPQNYSVVFRLWNQPTGGAAPVYGELQVVTVANGYFSVLLGQGTAYQNGGTTDPQPPLSTVFTNAGNLYVEMTVKGLASGADVTILPRLQLVSAPYAFLAANANALVNATSGAKVITSSGNNVSVSGAVTATSFTGNGSGLTSLNAADLTGQVPAAALSIVAMLAGGNAFTGNQTVMSGNVGIGTTTPGATFTIQQSIQHSDAIRLSGQEYYNGSFFDTAGISLLVGVNRNNNRQLWFADSSQVASPSSNNAVIRIMPNASTIDSIGTDGNTAKPLYFGNSRTLSVVPGGYVGINSTAPRCPLDVEDYADVAVGPYEYLNGNNVGGPETAQTIPMGIFSASRIVTGAEFDALSDSRIKEVVGRSDTRGDLATVRKLQITDYRKVDKVQYGGRLEKGVIAQEVEKIVPEAVSTSTNFIPNVYALPIAFGFTNQILSVALANPHDLVVGDRLKLITESGVVTVSVTAVPSARSFLAAGVKQAPRQLFVYGKEVTDFRSVNYDRLFTTGLGAIQELAKRMDQVEVREARLTELEQKAARVAVLERQVSDLKEMVLQMAASNKATKLAGETPADSPSPTAAHPATLTTASLGH
jgi:hypothetical protein